MSKTQIVGVTYADNINRTYDFFTDIDGLEVGDTVVVRSTTGLQVVTVAVAATENDFGTKATAWVIDKIDFTSETKRKAKKEIEKQLKAAIESTSVIERAKQLASLNPAINALIAQLEELEK